MGGTPLHIPLALLMEEQNLVLHLGSLRKLEELHYILGLGSLQTNGVVMGQLTNQLNSPVLCDYGARVAP